MCLWRVFSKCIWSRIKVGYDAKKDESTFSYQENCRHEHELYGDPDPESVGTLEPGSKPSTATGSQTRLLGIFVLASLGCSWEAFLSWYTKTQNFCLFLLDFWMARSDLIFFYFCLVRGAQIVGSWDPNAEKVETERGNGKISPTRAKNGVIALH